MAANKMRLLSSRIFQNYNICNGCKTIQKSLYCTTKTENEEPVEVKKSGFALFEEKELQLMQEPETSKTPEPFVSLLRNSKFIQLGDPVGKKVIGEIYHVVGDDLYIDFGWKFPTVCRAPEKNKKFYVEGAKVKLLIKDLELATKFLGSDEEITLCEADCVLLGLADRSKLTK